MIRSFLPVGQGAFYTEQFDCGMNIVYDCGSSTGKSAVEEADRRLRLSRGKRFRRYLFPICMKITSTGFHFFSPTAVWRRFICRF